jgi:hypothetical protein
VRFNTQTLATWLKADLHRGKRDRRTIKTLYEGLVKQGYSGGAGCVSSRYSMIASDCDRVSAPSCSVGTASLGLSAR